MICGRDVTQSTETQPFDERAALEELERLADKIVLSRQQRQQAVAEFEAFVRTFKQERHASITPTYAAGAPAPALPASNPPTAARGPIAPTVKAGSEPSGELLGLSVPHEYQPRAVSQRALFQVPYLRVGLVAAGILVVVFLMVRLWRGTSPEQAAPAGQSAPAGTTSSGAGAATLAPTAVSGTPRALSIELTTVRPVWTRVIVDDRKTIERELPAGERIPLGADRSISIRAGDAGAIRLTVDGKDHGALGQDGQILTRTWNAPPSRAR